MNDVKFPQRVGRFSRTYKYTPEEAQGGNMKEPTDQAIIAMLPEMAELFPDTFVKDSIPPVMWDVKLEGTRSSVASEARVYGYGYALIYEACRLAVAQLPKPFKWKSLWLSDDYYYIGVKGLYYARSDDWYNKHLVIATPYQPDCPASRALAAMQAAKAAKEAT